MLHNSSILKRLHRNISLQLASPAASAFSIVYVLFLLALQRNCAKKNFAKNREPEFGKRWEIAEGHYPQKMPKDFEKCHNLEKSLFSWGRKVGKKSFILEFISSPSTFNSMLYLTYSFKLNLLLLWAESACKANMSDLLLSFSESAEWLTNWTLYWVKQIQS